MADDADRSEPHINNTVAFGIAKARKEMTQRSLYAMGSCHYCSSGLASGKLFCDSECAGDWQFERDRLRAQGL